MLKNSKLIDTKDFQFLDYVLNRSLENVEIKDYLKFLQDVIRNAEDVHPYKQLLDYGKEKQLNGEIYK